MSFAAAVRGNGDCFREECTEQPRWLVSETTGRHAAAAALFSLEDWADAAGVVIRRAAPAAQTRTNRLESIDVARLCAGRDRSTFGPSQAASSPAG